MAGACYDVAALQGGVRPGGTIDASPPDAEPPTVALPPGFCGSFSPRALFCETFDEDVPLTDRWNGAGGGAYPPVLVIGDSTVARVVDASASSPPGVLSVLADTKSHDRRGGFVINGFAVTDAKAVELSVSVRSPSFELYTDLGKDGGPIESGGHTVLPPVVNILAFGVVDVNSVVATLYLSRNALQLRSGLLVGSDTSATTSVLVARFDYANILRSAYVRLHVAIGPPEIVAERVAEATGAVPLCPGTAAVAAAWGSLPIGRTACVELDPRVLPLAGREVAAVVGASLDGPARVHLLYDDVAVRALP